MRIASQANTVRNAIAAARRVAKLPLKKTREIASIRQNLGHLKWVAHLEGGHTVEITLIRGIPISKVNVVRKSSGTSQFILVF